MTQSPSLPELPPLEQPLSLIHPTSLQRMILDYATAHGLACYEAGSAAAAQAVPEGFVLVPREPTFEMNKAGQEAVWDFYPDDTIEGNEETARAAYFAMLAAAPTQGAEGAAPQAVVGEPHWTIIAPDGWKITGDKPITLIVEANKYEREINPAEAERQHTNLMNSIAEEQAEHERDRAELVNRFLRWPLPKTVFTDAGTGTVEPSKRPENWNASGTNLLTANEASAMLAFVLDCDEGDRELAHRSLAALTPSPTPSPTPTAPQEAKGS